MTNKFLIGHRLINRGVFGLIDIIEGFFHFSGKITLVRQFGSEGKVFYFPSSRSIIILAEILSRAKVN